MKKKLILILLSVAICRAGFGKPQVATDQLPQAPFSEFIVKKKIGSAICDTCTAHYFLNAEPNFTYLITGSGYVDRFSPLLQTVKEAYKDSPPYTTIHLVSSKDIGITFIPSSLREGGKLIKLYRGFGGEEYKNLEFEARRNAKVITEWTPLLQLGTIKDYAIFGSVPVADKTVVMPWPQIRHAGNFQLAINDTLTLTLRNINTKNLYRTIVVIRPAAIANHFFYYELKLTSDKLSGNLQQILNNTGGPLNLSKGDTTVRFEKDDQSIGILRFAQLAKNEELQYSFVREPYKWQTAKSESPEEGTFVVLGNDLPPGTYHDIYLRYSSQPETIHKITVFVKARPFQMPWGMIALISMVLLVAVGVVSYTIHFKNKIKLAVLKRKNEDTETRLSLLSGQLNPHFLYNSLNAIQGTINSNNPDRANAYIGSVAAFMRNVMDNGKKEFVSLHEELKIEEDYLKLEQQRANFTYTINIAPDLDAKQIDFPPLLLQPVLENSIRHAFNATYLNPVITINIIKKDKSLYIELIDNGSKNWDLERVQEGHGLSLTKKRMAVYNDRLESMSIQMQINYQPNKGTVTTFTLKNWLA
jgi:hypothetical protein